MEMKRYIILLLLLFVFLFSAVPILAQNETKQVYFFYSKTCPHCHKEMLFLQEFEKEHPEISIVYTVVWDGNKENDELFKQMAGQYGVSASSVPKTFIEDKIFFGFTEINGELEYREGKGYLGYQNQIENALLGYAGETPEEPAKPAVFKTAFFVIFLPILIFLIIATVLRKKYPLRKRYWLVMFIILLVVTLFIFTKTIPVEQVAKAIEHLPFPVFTFIIAILDGFNPCAMFVLTFLLALLAYTGSRKKMTIIGLVFILTSGLMYFLYMLFMLGILNTPIFESNKFILRMVVGFIALIAGAINIKDFFWFKKGVSLTIPEKQKLGIIARMRRIVNEIKEAETKKAVFIAIIATIILAAFVNIIELACTLMLPLVYTSVLVQNFSGFIIQVSYIAFYCLIYIIPLLVIFISFVYSLKVQKLTEKQGRIMKLIGGLLILGLGLIILLRPELLMFG